MILLHCTAVVDTEEWGEQRLKATDIIPLATDQPRWFFEILSRHAARMTEQMAQVGAPVQKLTWHVARWDG